jgi:hypothetical protein
MLLLARPWLPAARGPAAATSSAGSAGACCTARPACPCPLQSYAGKYIPALADYALQASRPPPPPQLMPLVGQRPPQGQSAQAQQQQQQPRRLRDAPDKPLFDLRGGRAAGPLAGLLSRTCTGRLQAALSGARSALASARPLVTPGPAARTGLCHLFPPQHHHHPPPNTARAGICIGNGLTDPRTQTTMLSKTAVQVGMVSSQQAAKIDDRIAEVSGPGGCSRARPSLLVLWPGCPGTANRFWPGRCPA